MIESIRRNTACRVLAFLLGLAAPGTPVLSIAADSAARCLSPAGGRRLPCHSAATTTAEAETQTTERAAAAPVELAAAATAATPDSGDHGSAHPCHGAPAGAESAPTTDVAVTAGANESHPGDPLGAASATDRSTADAEASVPTDDPETSARAAHEAGAGPCCCNGVRIATTSRCGCGHDHSGAAIAPGDPTLPRAGSAPFTPFERRPRGYSPSRTTARDADTPEPPPPVLTPGSRAV